MLVDGHSGFSNGSNELHLGLVISWMQKGWGVQNSAQPDPTVPPPPLIGHGTHAGVYALIYSNCHFMPWWFSTQYWQLASQVMPSPNLKALAH
jgi:hypothetical protein